MTNSKISIELVYALADKQTLLTFDVPQGTTLGQAVELSGIRAKHPEIDTVKGKFGIFSKLTKPDVVLREKDRIEIYRPLIADPKEVRRKRAEEGKVMKKGGGDA
jgi:putative ubiquitin-RnfH superfamily antitoxin RatB of RatAB toxin-antitoxin module